VICRSPDECIPKGIKKSGTAGVVTFRLFGKRGGRFLNYMAKTIYKKGGHEMNWKKYRRFPPFVFKERTWPDKTIEKAPIWCSVDLRDGNQALPDPMNVEKKLKMFNLLKKMGFK